MKARPKHLILEVDGEIPLEVINLGLPEIMFRAGGARWAAETKRFKVSIDVTEKVQSKYETGQIVAILTHDGASSPTRVDSGKFDKIINIYEKDGSVWLRFLTYSDLPEIWVRALTPKEIAQ